MDTNFDTSDDGDLSRFEISAKLIERLRSRGIEKLFPVQSRTFDIICSGSDVVVLARTGTGKTLAFALPIIQLLLNNRVRSKLPSVVVLAPTRELVVQISSEFSSLCESDFVTLAVYGGVPIGPQRQSLRQGVDILVATPGRIIDLIERGALSMSSVKYVVLDEVDRMLDMGFAKDVESILTTLYDGSATESKPQTLLFSATLPSWVSTVAEKYLQDDAHHISLIEEQDNKTALSVTHLALPCPYQERPATIADVIRTYCKRKQSRCIVFCERKKDADELAAHSAMSSDCHVFHGDIPQDKRELVLGKFREGKYRTLITTNVAARGLDVPEVDLVIQCHPPRDTEDYIHRSGRTGRAERLGTSVVFYNPRERPLLNAIESRAGIRFQRISAPSLEDIVDSWAGELIEALTSIPENTWSAFTPTAEKLLDAFRENGGIKKSKKNKDPLSEDSAKVSKSTLLLRALCCALAHFSGKNGTTESRSLLTAYRGWTTFKLQLPDMAYRKGRAYAVLRQQLDESVLESIKNLSFIKDHTGFVFDLPAHLTETVTSTWKDDESASLETITELPELEPEPQDDGFFRGGRGNFRGRSGSFRGSRGRGGNFRNGLSFSSRDDGGSERFPSSNRMRGNSSFSSRGAKRSFTSSSEDGNPTMNKRGRFDRGRGNHHVFAE